MSETEAPVFIIVAALMSIVGIALVMNITTGFFADEAAHSDNQQYSLLLSSIEDKCEQLEDVGEIHISDSVEVELQRSEIEIDDSSNELILKPDDEPEPIESGIDCNADIDSHIDENTIGVGSHRIVLTENNGVIEVSDQ